MSPYDTYLLGKVTLGHLHKRWTAQRKAALLTLIERGVLTVPDACSRYAFTPEEIAAWDARQKVHGHAGLMQTRLQAVRA